MNDYQDPPWAHPMTDIHDTVEMGYGTTVWAFATICRGVKIGLDCSVGSQVYIGRNTTLGNAVRINGGTHVTDHMVIGNRVFIGPNVSFTNDRHPVSLNPNYKLEPPIVEDDVSIGGSAVILPGVRLGRGCVVGAGAVVRRDVPPGTTVVGYEATPLGICVSCGKTSPRATWDRQYCRNCRRENGRRHKERHPGQHTSRTKAAVASAREDALRHYSGGTPRCACCGVTELKFLAIDHINGGGSRHRESIGYRIELWLKANNWPAGYQILCHNCNMAKYHGGCPHIGATAMTSIPPSVTDAYE